MSLQWTVTQIGAREHYGVAVALNRVDKLRALYTDMWWSHGRAASWLPVQLRALAARRHPELANRRVHGFTTSALFHELSRRMGRSLRNPYDGFIATGRWFAERVRRDLERRGLTSGRDAFFGYDTGCLETLALTRDAGVTSVVDQIDAARVGEEIMNEERERWPGWEREPAPVPEAYWQRLAGEWALADYVVVNSRWTRTALEKQGVPAEKIHIVPLAYEAPIGAHQLAGARGGGSHAFSVLWLGNVTLRKGIPYLFEAARLLASRNVEFVVAGDILISAQAMASAPSNMRFIGRVPRSALTPVYANSDLFVFPTLSDGFGLTQLEAMAHGLPVIATPNCGNVVTDGVDGFVIPIRDPQRLASAIETLIVDRQLHQRMSHAAMQKAGMFSISRISESLSAIERLESPGSADERLGRAPVDPTEPLPLRTVRGTGATA